ncbi:MAG: hypothetical protein LBT74_11985 [Acidobacteriota bacterium]|jgi:hypothetical protein|nr:hypothetical protein [Acidobacteriota bacterium]
MTAGGCVMLQNRMTSSKGFTTKTWQDKTAPILSCFFQQLEVPVDQREAPADEGGGDVRNCSWGVYPWGAYAKSADKRYKMPYIDSILRHGRICKRICKRIIETGGVDVIDDALYRKKHPL